MAREIMPALNQRLIRPGSSDPPIIVIGAILHVDAGNNPSLFNYFNGPSGGIESHVHVPKSGKPEQYRVFGREADANYKANSFYANGKRYGFVSIETQGYGAGEWNDHQIGWIKEILAWLAETQPAFRLQVTPGPFSPGVGYHIMWGSPGQWTPVSKSCPGPDRIRQFNNVLAPWMGKPDIVVPTEEEEVSAKEFFTYRLRNFKSQGGGERTFQDWFLRNFNQAGRAMAYANEAKNRTQRIERALTQLSRGFTGDVRQAVEAELKQMEFLGPEDLQRFGTDTDKLAAELAPLLLANQTELTEANIQNALATVFRRAAANMTEEDPEA